MGKYSKRHNNVSRFIPKPDPLKKIQPRPDLDFLDQKKYYGLNEILAFCKTPMTATEIAEHCKIYTRGYIRRILLMMVQEKYMDMCVIHEGSYPYKMYKSLTFDLTAEECIDAIKALQARRGKTYIPVKDRPDYEPKPLGKPDSKAELVVEGNKKIYSVEYLHKLKTDSINDLKKLGLYKEPKHSAFAPLQGSEGIV